MLQGVTASPLPSRCNSHPRPCSTRAAKGIFDGLLDSTRAAKGILNGLFRLNNSLKYRWMHGHLKSLQVAVSKIMMRYMSIFAAFATKKVERKVVAKIEIDIKTSKADLHCRGLSICRSPHQHGKTLHIRPFYIISCLPGCKMFVVVFFQDLLNLSHCCRSF